MKLRIFALAGLLMMPVLGWAETRIAVLDMEAVIRSTAEAAELREQLRRDLADEEVALRKLSDEGNALKAKLEKEGDFLSTADREQLVKQVQFKFQEFQALGARIQQETQRRNRELVSLVTPRIEAALEQIIKDKKIDLVLNRRGAVFVTPQLDLSTELSQALAK